MLKRCTSSTVGLLSWNRITMIHGWIFSNLTYHLHFWAQCLNLRGRESDGSLILNPIPQNPRLFEWRSLIAKSYSRIWWSLVWSGWCDSFHRFTTQPTKPLSCCFSPKCSKQIPAGHLWNHHIKWTKQVPFYFLPPQSLPSLCWRGEAKNYSEKSSHAATTHRQSIEKIPSEFWSSFKMVVSIFMWKKNKIESFTCFPSSIIGWLAVPQAGAAKCPALPWEIHDPERKPATPSYIEGREFNLLWGSCCFVKRAMVNSLYMMVIQMLI